MSAPIDHLDASDSAAVRRHAATFRKVREARRAQAATDDAARSAGVEPSDGREPRVSGREASSDEVPRPAASVAALARSNGWAVRETYAEGPPSDDGAVVASVVVRCDRISDGARQWACACWRASTPSPPMKWAWSLAWCLLADASDGLRKVGSRELRAWLSDQERVDRPSDGAVE